MLRFKPTQLAIITILLTSLAACNVAPVPINFGSDGCHFCKMTIVDKQHAAELVSSTGKAFKYDAIECMVDDLKNHDPNRVELLLVSDFGKSQLVDAKNAYFLVSENLPSPMGANLSGFETKDKALFAHQEYEGDIYTWHELTTDFHQIVKRNNHSMHMHAGHSN